mgnify:CR=1 FL=1
MLGTPIQSSLGHPIAHNMGDIGFLPLVAAIVPTILSKIGSGGGATLPPPVQYIMPPPPLPPMPRPNPMKMMMPFMLMGMMGFGTLLLVMAMTTRD